MVGGKKKLAQTQDERGYRQTGREWQQGRDDVIKRVNKKRTAAGEPGLDIDDTKSPEEYSDLGKFMVNNPTQARKDDPQSAPFYNAQRQRVQPGKR
jgi:hypothetical protein